MDSTTVHTQGIEVVRKEVVRPFCWSRRGVGDPAPPQREQWPQPPPQQRLQAEGGHA